MTCKQCDWCASNVATINIVGNALQLAVKLTGGILGGSQALIADAVHSLDDVFGSLVLWAGLKVSGAPPDEDHHWGHGNVEFIVALVIGVFLICAGVTIVVVAVTTIIQGTATEPGMLAVGAAAISIVFNELLYRHSLCIGSQVDSPAIIANAWENRADACTSFAAMIGVFGAKLGIKVLDPLAAIVVAFVIMRYAVKTLLRSFAGIVDHCGDPALIARLKRAVVQEEGVASVGGVSVRTVGQKRWIYIEARFDAETKVSETKQIMARLKDRMRNEFGSGGIGGFVIMPGASQPALEDVQ